MRLNLATYNIHAGFGTDGRFDPERLVCVLQELKADVVALQEVEHHYIDESDLLDYLAIKTNMTAIAGPILLRGTRHYGNALLTKLPVISVHRIDLSLPDREPRGALDVRLNCYGQKLQVVATHLGLRPWERRQQVRQILSLFNSKPVDISVLMGDLNEWFLWGRPLRWLHAHFKHTLAYATFPSRCPVFALDRFWIHPRNRLIKLEVHTSTIARTASDHLPLKAVIEI